MKSLRDALNFRRAKPLTDEEYSIKKEEFLSKARCVWNPERQDFCLYRDGPSQFYSLNNHVVMWWIEKEKDLADNSLGTTPPRWSCPGVSGEHGRCCNPWHARTPLERDVPRLYEVLYALWKRTKTPSELAVEYGVTAARISQLKQKYLAKVNTVEELADLLYPRNEK